MSIVASVILEDRAQADGRRYVRERHTDHLGAFHFAEYLCTSGFDANAALAARVAILEARLKAGEILLNMTRAYAGDTRFTFEWSTTNQNAAQLREEYKSATGFALTALGYSVEKTRQDWPLSDNQMKSLFGVNDAQLTTLKTKLTNQYNRYLSIVGDVGQ